MSGLREGRPSPPSPAQRGHKSLSPIASLLGGALGGAAGGAASGANAAATSDTNYDPSVTATTGITPTASNNIGGANGQINIAGAPYHPGFWANLATGGRAGLETGLGQNQAYYQAQLQAAQQATELEKQRIQSGGLLDVAKQEGLNAQQTAELQAHLEDLKSRNLANNPANNDYLNNVITPQDQSAALMRAKTGTVQAGNQMQLASLLNNIQSNPDFAQSLSLGTRASAAMPYNEALSKAIRVGPYEAAFANPTGIMPMSYTGVTPMGNTTTKGFNQKTLQQTETSTPNAPLPARATTLGPNGLPQIPIIQPSNQGGGPISNFGGSGIGGASWGWTPNNPLTGMQTPSNVSPSITPTRPVSNISANTLPQVPAFQQNTSFSPNQLTSGSSISGIPDWLFRYMAAQQAQQ